MTYGRRTRRIEAIFPKDRGYFCCRAVVDFDCELKIPIKTMIYNGQRRLMESYGFEELKLNAGLNDFDFDPRNPAYNF
jgi:hypothetical protein